MTHDEQRVTMARWIIAASIVLAMGVCNKCGYDLRATPSRCPECGTVPGK